MAMTGQGYSEFKAILINRLIKLSNGNNQVPLKDVSQTTEPNQSFSF